MMGTQAMPHVPYNSLLGALAARLVYAAKTNRRRPARAIMATA